MNHNNQAKWSIQIYASWKPHQEDVEQAFIDKRKQEPNNVCNYGWDFRYMFEDQTDEMKDDQKSKVD